jgi:hypothetical protein
LIVLRDALLQDLSLLFVSLDLRFSSDASVMLTAPSVAEHCARHAVKLNELDVIKNRRRLGWFRPRS